MRLPSFPPDAVSWAFAIVTIIVAAALLILVLYQIISWIGSATYKSVADAHIRKQIEEQRASGKTSLYELMIPTTAREKKTFALVALTAGVCEELLLRGLLFFLLYSMAPTRSVYVVPVIAGVFFGILHAYQGASGVAKAGLLGIVLGALYLASGSLIPGILLHFALDNM